MRLDSMCMFHIINTNGIKQLHDTRLHVVQLLCEKLIISLSGWRGPVLYCISVTNSHTVESRHGTDHTDFCLTGCGWVSACTDLSGYWAMCVSMYVVWLCVCVCLRSTERWYDCADMCPTVWLAPGPLSHTPLAWLPWAPCIMQRARDTALHDNVRVHAWCVYVCVCCVWKKERASLHGCSA